MIRSVSQRATTIALLSLVTLGSITFATAEEPKAASGEKQITNSIGMKLTFVPSGEFMMGSSESAESLAAFFKKYFGIEDVAAYAKKQSGIEITLADLIKNEQPQHQVRISKPFYLGTYHVTRGQFRQFVKESGYKADTEKAKVPGAYGWNSSENKFEFNAKYSWRNPGFEQSDKHPVVMASWNDAIAFCRWLSKKEGKIYRLPTEAEWEYACRAGTKTRYYNGDDPETLVTVGNVPDAAYAAKFSNTPSNKASDGYVFTAPVGQFKPNAFGLYDMHGNAWQWCADWYGEDYYSISPVDDPKGPDTGYGRVRRGGSWYTGDCGSATRNMTVPDFTEPALRSGFSLMVRLFDAGFRVATTQ
jgi:formylglycine-generating enzyme